MLPMSRHTEGGFTLIESLVAMAVLGLALVSLLSATSVALRSESRASRHLEAVSLAEAKMNERTALPLFALAPYADPKEGRFGGDLDIYRWTATVRRSDESPRLFRTFVRVSWAGGEFDLQTTFYRVSRIGVGQAEP